MPDGLLRFIRFTAQPYFISIPVDIIDAVHSHILPLKGYTPARPNDKAELMRRARLGL